MSGADDTDSVPAGDRLFARYAHAPNSRGYCGPELGAALQRLAAGHPVEGMNVTAAARRFSGAWPYQQLLAEHLGIEDPLDVRVGRAYWTGNDLTTRIDAQEFGRDLLRRFGAQAGHYWHHLTPELLPEVSPTHAFHVLGVYPWSRLLGGGRPEPVSVLDDCRIRVGRVVDIESSQMVVEVDRLVDEDPGLRLADPSRETIGWQTDDGPFVEADALTPGAWVAVHWGFACDVLTPSEADTCRRLTATQVSVTDARVRRD